MLFLCPCPFCWEDLLPLYRKLRLGEAGRCPRCGVVVMFTTTLEGIRGILTAEVIRGKDVTPSPAQRVEIRVIPELVSNGERIHLAVGWDPDELLDTPTVARILRITSRRVTHLAEEGRFPHAIRVPPKNPTAKRTFWRIPRHVVLERARRVRQEGN